MKLDKTDYLIVAFVIGAVLMLGYCESADADTEFAIEHAHDSNAGITDFNEGFDRICGRLVFDSGASFVACPLLAVGGDTHSGFELGIADELWDRWEGQITLTSFDDVIDGGFALRRVIGDGPFQMFIGGSYWIDQSPGSDSNLTFNLGLRYTF